MSHSDNTNSIVNKVELSGIKTVDLLRFKPIPAQLYFFDVKQFLLHEYLFREKEMKAVLLTINKTELADRFVTIGCSNDAIVPSWVYSYIAVYFSSFTEKVRMGSEADAVNAWWQENLAAQDWQVYKGEKVVLKASTEIPNEIYVAAALKLLPLVQSLMWGEAGSPVVLFKAKK